MGMAGDIFGGVGKIFKGANDYRSGEQAKENAYDAQLNYYADVDRKNKATAMGDYDPTYASDLVGPYQRGESPAARAYLESLLAGDNAQQAATPWDDRSAAAGAKFGARTGGYDNLIAAGASDRASTPWATKRPDKVDTSALDYIAEEPPAPWRGEAYKSEISLGRETNRSRR